MASIIWRIGLIFVLVSDLAQAAVLRVGPNRALKQPSAAAAIVRNGDVIEIDAGTYRGDVTVWRRNNLTIRGVGGLAHLEAAGQSAEGKAIWVIKGRNTTIENVEFSGAAVSDGNGAGIRQEGAGLILRHCNFHDNENGILGGAGEVVIESSEFAHNGAGDGRTHNIYIGEHTRRFILRFSYSHHARVGHNVKSRAQENYILYNRIMDEADGDSSYDIDLPDGGIGYVIGNLIQQGPMSDNSTILSFGAEGLHFPKNELYVINNTFVNDKKEGRFIAIAGNPGPVRVVNNLFVGNGTLPADHIELMTNLMPDSAGLADRQRYDYRLNAESPAIDSGSDPGSANGFSLAPVAQYVHPYRGEPRPAVGRIDVGAYEYAVSPAR
jgi:hypothetical protein